MNWPPKAPQRTEPSIGSIKNSFVLRPAERECRGDLLASRAAEELPVRVFDRIAHFSRDTCRICGNQPRDDALRL
jgi:hypothetical protein